MDAAAAAFMGLRPGLYLTMTSPGTTRALAGRSSKFAICSGVSSRMSWANTLEDIASEKQKKGQSIPLIACSSLLTRIKGSWNGQRTPVATTSVLSARVR